MKEKCRTRLDRRERRVSEVPQSAKSSLVWNLLRSPRLALFMLSLTMVYSAAVSWLPWLASAAVAPPVWAVQLGLDHPYRSLPFLAACALLFVNTFACTWDRFGRVLRLWRGELPGFAAALPASSAAELRLLLRDAGFREHGGVHFKNRFALWGGFVLHVGILAILLSVAVQQAYSDGGSFEISEQEVVDLAVPGVVFGREAGYLAPGKPPALQVALERFDAHRHQAGYAPDRQSTLAVQDPARPASKLSGEIDRSRGLAVGDTTIYQAIPSGYALAVEVRGLGVRSVHLREKGSKSALAEVADSSGEPVRFVLEAERPLADPKGTGQLTLFLERRGGRETLTPGVAFAFGRGPARVVAISRWGGFTYARTPGIGLVFSGFALALAGCFLLLFPAGVARLEGDTAAPGARFCLSRGGELLLLEGRKLRPAPSVDNDFGEN